MLKILYLGFRGHSVVMISRSRRL